jgi:hypothetical protein
MIKVFLDQRVFHVENRLINGTYRLPCFVLLVVLVATAKSHFEVQALVAGTKQQNNQAGVKIVRPGCFVVPATIARSLRWILCKLIYLEQSTLLRYP